MGWRGRCTRPPTSVTGVGEDNDRARRDRPKGRRAQLNALEALGFDGGARAQKRRGPAQIGAGRAHRGGTSGGCTAAIVTYHGSKTSARPPFSRALASTAA